MSKTQKIILVYAASLLFLAVELTLLVAERSLLAALIPVALFLGWMAIFKLDWLLLTITFFTPLSVPLTTLVPGLSFDMNLPTEPLIVGIMLILVLKLAHQRKLDPALLKHPVTLALAFYLGWMFLTSLSSTMVLVSVKYWVSKVWFIIAFYFLGYALFQSKINFYRFVVFYGLGFLPVIAYAFWRHSFYGFFDSHAANFVMNPFYKDHTSYGAMLVFFLPVFVWMMFQKSFPLSWRDAGLFLALIFVVALIFSYTRAAWLSLFVALLMIPIFYFRVKFKVVVWVIVVGIVGLYTMQDQLVERLAANKQESSSNLSGHVSSMSNISTDASNVERLNRWSCAISMFKEKPLVGWGPGTYMFQYAPFQEGDLRTIISTNNGDGGNAHSEYLGPLADSGILGFVSILLLFMMILRTGFRAYERAANKSDRMLAAAVVLAMVSYFVHGFLNNFLDSDKAAIPFWAFAAFLVVLDVKASKSGDVSNH